MAKAKAKKSNQAPAHDHEKAQGEHGTEKKEARA